MRIKIWSHWRGETWAGDLPQLDGISDQETLNERIFRLFNVVDEADVDRLQTLNYDLPSLSVGDHVTHAGGMYVVASAGFIRLTDPPAVHPAVEPDGMPPPLQWRPR